MDVNGLLAAYLLATLIITAILYWFGFGYITAFVVGLFLASYGVSQIWDFRYSNEETFSATIIMTFFYVSIFLVFIWFLWLLFDVVFTLSTGQDQFTNGLFLRDR